MSPEERYEALVAWATALPPSVTIESRIGAHTGYLAVTTTIRHDGERRVSVRVRNPNRSARTQYRGVAPYHLAGAGDRFQIKGPNGRYIDWTPERIDAA